MFTPILLTFASDAGPTREIADLLAETLREESLETQVRPLSEVTNLEGFGTVVLGAPFTGERWSAEARAFLVAHRDALTRLPVAVFATGSPMTGVSEAVCHREELLEELARMRWLHPIAAAMFCDYNQPGNGRHAPKIDPDAVTRWARLVAHVLYPAALR